MKELTFYRTSKNLVKASKIMLECRFLRFTPHATFMTHWLEQQIPNFSVITI